MAEEPLDSTGTGASVSRGPDCDNRKNIRASDHPIIDHGRTAPDVAKVTTTAPLRQLRHTEAT